MINFSSNNIINISISYSDLLFLILSSILMILLGSLLTIKKNGINFVFTKIYIIVIIYTYILYIILTKNIETLNSEFGKTHFQNLLLIFGLIFFFILYTYIIQNNVKSTYEYPIIYFISLIGMHLILKTTDMFIWFLAIEISSFSFYTLAAYKTNRSYLQTEAGLKYFLFGAVASSLYLFGISLLYMIFGTVDWDSIAALSYFPLDNLYIYYIALLLIFIGLFFKLGIAPFHFWLPLVYTYSSSLVTFLFILLPKIPLIYLLFKFSTLNFSFVMIFPLIASLFVGTIFAFKATNLKTFLAYSSIANGAFFLAPLLNESIFSFYSLLFYIFIYNILIIIAFLPLLFFKRGDGSFGLTNLRDLIILKKVNPLLAIFYSLMALSFAGVPPLSGFFSKLLILISTLSFSSYFLTCLLLAFSLIASYYYLRLLKIIFFPFSLKYSFITSLPFLPSLFITTLSMLNIFIIFFPTYLGQLLY